MASLTWLTTLVDVVNGVWNVVDHVGRRGKWSFERGLPRYFKQGSRKLGRVGVRIRVGELLI